MPVTLNDAQKNLIDTPNVNDESVENPIHLQKYVRVRSEQDAKFVMFDFAIGDPSLYVELVLPPAAFEAFCENNQTIPMTGEQMARNDAEEDRWRYGDQETDTLVGHNHTQILEQTLHQSN